MSSGDKQWFGKGDVLLAEDVSGQGHKTRVIGKKPWRLAFVTPLKAGVSFRYQDTLPDSIIFQDIAGRYARHCPEPI